MINMNSEHLKIARAECTTMKPKFWNERMNEENILGFKLCTEAEILFSDALHEFINYYNKSINTHRCVHI